MVLRIASPRCSLTITVGIYFQQLRHLADAIQEKQPTRLREVMLLHENSRPHRSWVGKSFRTHLIHLILRPPIFTFPTLYRPTFKELPFQMKMCYEHGLTTSSTQNHAISTGAESKNYSSVGSLLSGTVGRNLGCSSAKGRFSTANSGTKAAVLPEIEWVQ